MGIEKEISKDYILFDSMSMVPSKAVLELANIVKIGSLTDRNDGKGKFTNNNQNFEQIADYIEENY